VSRLTQVEEARLFELLDSYSRNHHRCFLSELFPDESENEYVLCFRPVSARLDSSDRYACRYLRVKIDDARTASQMRELPHSIIERLEGELSRLEVKDRNN